MRYSWITQVYIVFGLTYGLLLYEREQSEIKELLNSYSLSKWKKTVKYLLLFIEAAGIESGLHFFIGNFFLYAAYECGNPA